MKELEIYIHIPFCAKKCNYCDFLSAPSDEATMHNYVKALIKEVELSREKFNGYLVRSVFVGGGTPSILRGEWIEDIMKAVFANANVSETAEITIECNPGTLTKDKLGSYKKAKINRLSLGLQSANDAELKMLGRIHTWDDLVSSYEMAREAGFDNINIDIMSALPMQTVASFKETLEKVLSLNPEHISAYSLILEDGTPLKDWIENEEQNGNHLLPSEDDEREMYYETKSVLKANGYERYEISNYSKPGRECVHNLGYWDRVEYLGFGIGAASLYKNTRYSNIDELYKYIAFLDEYADVDRLQTSIEELPSKDCMEEFMFLGLRKTKGISKERFEQNFGRKIENVYGTVLEKLERQKLISIDGDQVILTEKGVDVSNIVLANFLL